MAKNEAKMIARGECNVSKFLMEALLLDFQQSHQNTRTETVRLYRVRDPRSEVSTKGFIVTVSDESAKSNTIMNFWGKFFVNILDAVDAYNKQCDFEQDEV